MKEINLIVFGMTVRGKTTFVQKLEEKIANKDKESYIINLVPSLMNNLYNPNFDLRDTVKNKLVMISNNIGLNCIILSLNLFSTKIDKSYLFKNQNKI